MIGSDNVVLLVRVLMRWGNKAARVLGAKPCGLCAARVWPAAGAPAVGVPAVGVVGGPAAVVA
jgi:hypothetical protein